MTATDKQLVKDVQRAKRTPMLVKKYRLGKAEKRLLKAFGI